MAVDKNLRELASAILKANGLDHDKWLSDKYTELIIGNASMLKAGIEEKKEVKTDIQSDTSLNSKEQQINQGINQRPWEQTS